MKKRSFIKKEEISKFIKKISFNGVINYIRNSIKKNPLVIFYVFGNVFNGLLLRLMTTGRCEVRAIILDLAFVLFFTAFGFLVKKKRRKLYYYITTFIMVAICIINSTYYNYYASFVSVSLLSTSVFVKDMGDVVSEFAVKITDGIYLWIFLGLYFINKKRPSEFAISKNNFLISLVVFGISLFIGCSLPPYNAWSRFVKLWNRVAVVDSWGPYIYQLDDIFQSIKPTFDTMFGHDEALRITKEYYENNSGSQTTNSYTGIYEGKNVIAIHAESLQKFVIGLEFNGKEVTPNINKLIKKSMYFNNFYAQVGVGTSSDTEFTYATSLLPSNNGTVFVNYYNDKFVTIQNLLKNKGYYVFSMHGNVGDFWNREAMHMNMGYDKFYSKSSFEIDEQYGLGLSDESFFRQVVPKIKEINESVGKPYYGTLITLTNHTPWKDADSYSDLDLTMKVTIDGEEVARDYLEGTTMGKYLKSVNYMDKAIGNFLEDMEKEGLLDNTVIVIYGDHDARLGRSQFNYMYNYDPVNDEVRSEDDPKYKEFNEYDYEIIRSVPLIMWNKNMKKSVKIDTPMGMIDVLPTLGNMLNVYNKYSLGQDIMGIKKENGIVVFKDGSYITDKIYYSAKNEEVYTLTNGVITDDYIKKNSDYADQIIDISNNIITYDLIKELE